MKLNVDFSALHQAIAPLGKVAASFSVTRHVNELESIASHLTIGVILGKDIQLDEIDGSHGVLSYHGDQVMLYIPDQGDEIQFILEDGKQGCRIHVAECSTLELMRETGRFDRYKVINRVDGFFPVFGRNFKLKQDIKGEADLGVCKNCLTLLNYQGYSSQGHRVKNQVVNAFSFEQLFSTYSAHFNSLPSNKKKGNYTADWDSISTQLRSELDYTCEQCDVNLTQYTKLLHAHHVNGNKADNGRSNLRALCIDCHKKQPHHSHMRVSNEDVLIINRLRREQHKFDVFDYQQLRDCADTALDGLLQKCQTMGLPQGELGVVINADVNPKPKPKPKPKPGKDNGNRDNNWDNNNWIAIDLCWQKRNVAVLIKSENTARLQRHGWTVFSAFEALNEFERFQAKVR
ncbi:HNH endonuclease [Shewanella surugensis]|uniref:HNH endonuclease n=1 Tax=Shewanella surugensis TaxID=212020 RepID=A0ABT0L6S9_9GAMM|nr:HNH endonuclease [Shewanella surugensis]MCL1123393.1 HNH endonuclease [Shewanella surugensis]